MKLNKTIFIQLILFLASLGFFFNNCAPKRFSNSKLDKIISQETNTGNPMTVSLKLGGATLGAVNKLSLCPQSVNFIPIDPLKEPVLVVIDQGSFSVGATDTVIDSIEIPEQVYDHAEVTLGLGSSCAQSVSLTNANGNFAADESIVLRFSSQFSITGLTRVLRLTTQPLVDQASTVSLNNQIKPVLEAANSGIEVIDALAFRQLQEFSVNNNSNNISIANFVQPVSSGNFMICLIFYNSSTRNVSGLSDTSGNSYWKVTSVNGAGALSGWTLESWSSSPITGGANFSVTANFSGTWSGEKNMSCHEYSGVERVMFPFETVQGFNGSNGNMNLPNYSTTFANDLIIGVAAFATSGVAGSGFTQRSGLNRMVSEDKVVNTLGNYGVSFLNSPGDWVAQFIIIKGN